VKLVGTTTRVGAGQSSEFRLFLTAESERRLLEEGRPGLCADGGDGWRRCRTGDAGREERGRQSGTGEPAGSSAGDAGQVRPAGRCAGLMRNRYG
jgi:hypothetical protein